MVEAHADRFQQSPQQGAQVGSREYDASGRRIEKTAGGRGAAAGGLAGMALLDSCSEAIAGSPG